MPIFAIQNEIEVEFTHKCNWNCPYCAINVHFLSQITDDDIDLKLQKIQQNSIVTISGGEPGLLTNQQVVKIITNLKNKNCTLYLNTNGTFIYNFPQYLKEFKQIIYHCSQNLDITDKILDVNKEIDVRYMIIVNDDNYDKLDAYLKYNVIDKHIKFDIIQATYNNIGRTTLSNKNKYELLAKYSKYMTTESIQRMIHEKEWNKMVFI